MIALISLQLFQADSLCVLYQVFPSRVSTLLGVLYTLLSYKRYNEHHILQRGLLITKNPKILLNKGKQTEQ